MPTPISVRFPAELRGRVERLARKRTVGVSTAIRTLVEERLAELERDEENRATLSWQREQALSAWSEFEASREVVAWDAMEQALDDALAAARGRRSSRQPSRATPRSRSRGSSSRTGTTGRSS
jgi:predicted transcriptional regulator